MVILKSEFNFNDKVYIIKDSKIMETRIRYIKFPDVSRFDEKPTDSIIQYGCCTDEELEIGDSIQETESWYDWRFYNQIGKTKDDLIDKMRNW